RENRGRGADVVYDSVGKATFEQSLSSLRPRGYMVLYGQSSGAVPPLDPQVLNARGSLFLTRPTLGNYSADRAELIGRAGDLFEWMAVGELQVRIDSTYALADAGKAHTALASRSTQGKLLLLP
ncbi:MAG TPA: zinc-binding dehydrogenase, partial [Roseiflexaceae bacterium]|nr:zinc-binding dehydrogenase [Roseiflexaceae bacterium]